MKRLLQFLLVTTNYYLLLFVTSSDVFAQINLGNISGTGQFQTGNVNSQLGNFLSTVINTITVMVVSNGSPVAVIRAAPKKPSPSLPKPPLA